MESNRIVGLWCCVWWRCRRARTRRKRWKQRQGSRWRRPSGAPTPRMAMACEVHVKQERPCCRCSLLQRLMVKMTCQIDAKIPTDLFRASRTFISTLVKASRQSSKLQLQTIQKKKSYSCKRTLKVILLTANSTCCYFFFFTSTESKEPVIYTFGHYKIWMNQGSASVTI